MNSRDPFSKGDTGPTGRNPKARSRLKPNKVLTEIISYDEDFVDFDESINDQSWADMVEDDLIPFYGDYPKPKDIKIGEILDQYLALPDDQKIVFLDIVQGMGYIIPKEYLNQDIPSKTLDPVQPEQLASPNSGENSDSPNLETSKPTIVGNFSRNPADGKFYPLQAPKVRSEEFLRLDEAYSRSRRNLSLIMRKENYVYDIDTHECHVRGKPYLKISKEINHDWWVAQQYVEKSKGDLKAYKRKHPEEFRVSNPENPRNRGKVRVPVMGQRLKGRPVLPSKLIN